jgi:transposase InsO family protein
MLLCIDAAMRHTHEYLVKYKSEALEKFKKWKALREKESGKQVKRFRTDGGGEYTSKTFAEYLESEGILKEMTRPYTHCTNGVVERANRTIMERVRCILDDARLSKKYWTFAVSFAVYIKNRTPTRSVVGKTPYVAWDRRKPSLTLFSMSGCLGFIHV